MDIKLDNLIDKIKKEGIDEAKMLAETILSDTQKSAAALIADAKLKAEQIVRDAEIEAEKTKANTTAALKQAARDTILVTKENLTKLFDRVFKKTISDAMTPEFLAGLIRDVVKQTSGDAKPEFIVSPKDIDRLTNLLAQTTTESLKEPIVLKVEKGISGGFRIGKKGSDVYYDLSDESIANFLMEFLNPSVREILK
ncbi:MAG: hypothetical protein COT43_09735 [Candidatus Marinimicrobia bacterium CG08_land_8_20_14_0_20_45_22]|nr:MAG: hypothetical protein COT43_09735 [Candidatus Marinimicrobia bacterium CG08_land_8_20_14_0_20_45_22]